MSTKPIEFRRSQGGWIWKEDRSVSFADNHTKILFSEWHDFS